MHSSGQEHTTATRLPKKAPVSHRAGAKSHYIASPQDQIYTGNSRKSSERMAGTTGLEPATSDVTGRRSNQLNYVPARLSDRLYPTTPYNRCQLPDGIKSGR